MPKGRKESKMFKTILVGKSGKGKNQNVEIEVNLNEEKGTLSIVGNVWNHLKTDIVCGGQLEEGIKDYIEKYLISKDKLEEIIAIWKRWHLNDLKAGTPKQEEAIRIWLDKGNKYDYLTACEYLKSIKLFNDGGYKYGTGWKTEEIPFRVLETIKSWNNL
jgi:hypothetical protein